MASPTPILDRIKQRESGKLIELHKQPRWIERMQRQGLPNKDLTGWRPSPDAA